MEERQAFLHELIRNQPDISRQEAQDRFEEKFDATLNPKLFQQVREQVEKEQSEPPPRMGAPAGDESEPSNEEDADAAPSKPSLGAAEGANGAAQPAKAKSKGGRQRNVFVDASKEQLVFLERIVQQLQEAGASNVRIDHSTDRWMVLVVDAK
jgi:hypothetical protein